jgi:hypothetical protein
MRILHLSDIHLTHPFKTFEEVWSGPRPHLHPGTFDFAVISGDLSQRSAPEEYARLGEFLERSILPLLSEKQRGRIVLVPGNHDVDWKADIGDKLSLAAELDGNPGFPRLLHQARLEPERSDLRIRISDHGHLEVLRIDPKRYGSRFTNVQRFFEDFYRDVPGPEHFRPFALTHPDDGEHWSAHVFPEDGIAFYGFSSCHGNDRYWTGAMISARAVEQARHHAEQHARGCTLIAVWHHGLDSGRGRPDHLGAEDIGRLYTAGFRIGFHGHTHRHAYETFDALFSNRFFIVSTGSLGAGSRERPDAVGNQFSIAKVYQSHVDVEVFNRDGTSTTYERNRERRRFLLKGANAPRLDQISHAASHQRTWTVDATGIAQVDIALTEVTLRGELTLALIEPPFCSVLADESAETSVGRLPVERKELPGGRIRFTIMAGQIEGKVDRLHWSYRISNCLALNRFDLRARGQRPSWLEHLPDGLDGRPYTVRFPCDELTLTMRLPEGTRLGTTEAMALMRIEERGLERWVPEPSEQKLWRKEPTGSQVRFIIPSPLVDHRYVIAYEPIATGKSHGTEFEGLLQWLLEQCRDRPSTPHSIPAALTLAIDEALTRLLGAPVGHHSVWAGYLWNPKRHQLMTAFGKFPNRGWAVRFAWGEGVAGHALRHSLEAGWVHGDASHQSLIYQQKPKAHNDADYSWLVSIPLLPSISGPALGVIGFAGNFLLEGTGEAQLREHAERVARQGREIDAGFIDFRNRLFSAVNMAFWQVLRSWREMTPQRRALVERICEELQVPRIPSSEEEPSRPRERG